MFKQNLKLVESTIKKHNRTANDVMYELVNTRLSKSLDSYIKSLSISYDYVSSKNSLNVMNKIVRKS